MTPVDQLKVFIQLFENAQTAFRHYGAYDTEPRVLFQGLLVRAVRGKDVVVPSDAEGWDLYADEPGVEAAAAALTRAARDCVQFIRDAPIAALPAVEAHLRRYCDRIVIAWRD
jgi:hypothetical protein